MQVTLRSHAKINLGLAIGPARSDGFHALCTLYQTVGAHDRLRVELRSEPGIALTADDRRVPLDSRNTVWKMLTLRLRGDLGRRLGVRVHIEKRLPIQGGLGGGSGNAAAALIGLERLLARSGEVASLLPAERLRLAAEVGSDVPLFLLGGTVLGLGRGEQVIPLRDLCRVAEPLEVVLALPAVGVSTPAAFRAVDAERAGLGLTAEAEAARLEELSCAFAAAACEEHASGVFAPRGESLAGSLLSTLVQTGALQNDFQPVVFRQHPLLSEIRQLLAGPEPLGACLLAALSGSGSAVFGLFREGKAAADAETRLSEAGIASLHTATLGRAAYWNGMIEEEED